MVAENQIMTEAILSPDHRLTDFATIFAHMWYRDFPLQRSLREKAQRADWTTHIGMAVRSTADLMGLFTHFESGGLTDAILRDSNKNVVAALEWEWSALHTGNKINEFDKLRKLCEKEGFKGMCFSALTGYARERATRAGADRIDYAPLLAAALENYAQGWPAQGPPLLLALVHYENAGKAKDLQRRKFTKLTMHKISGQDMSLLREQPACPWDVQGSRWAQTA